MSVDDEIALLAGDIRRYTNNDGRVDEALTQLLKIVAAEVDALAFEARTLDTLLVRTTTELEAERIRHRQPEGRWIHRG
jgi:hypothetical protein